MKDNMKIAFPTNDRITVEEHFGHAREFALAVIQNKEVVRTDYIVPPPHAPGVIPEFVKNQGAAVLITGGMGAMAVNFFKENGIDVILGASGSIEDSLRIYLEGNLKSSDSVCKHH